MYYKSQLDKIGLSRHNSIQIFNDEDDKEDKTNFLDLNLESLPIIIKYLKDLEVYLQETQETL